MDKPEMIDTIKTAKTEKGLTWEAIASATGLSPVYVTSACLGMNSLDSDQAARLCKALGLPGAVAQALTTFPHKSWEKAVPTDPVIYRLYEVVGVYGDTLKELIHEQFGNGIMSAIDFTMHVEKIADPKGDRVQITMNGKFLPYKSW